jgi:hypothetical protein
MRTLRSALVVATVAAVCAGCGLFKPAIPEKAKGTVIVGDYSDPDSTLATMAYAIEAKGNQGGQDAYAAALADTTLDHHAFQALFDPITAQRWLSTNTDLPIIGRDEERHFYGTFSTTNAGNEFVMRWSEGQASDDRSNDSLNILYRKYEIFLKHNAAITDTIGTGFAELHMIRSGTRWVMWRWIDREVVPPVSDALSFGQLRLKYP